MGSGKRSDQEITQLTTWRETWYPDAPTFTIDPMMGGMATMDNMNGTTMMDPEVEAARMCASTEPFGLAFLDVMIPHHQSAIMMADVAAPHTINHEIQELAETIINVHTQELAQMEHWRDAWFGEATPSGS